MYWDYFIGGERAPYTLRLDHFVSNPLESPFGQALALLKGLRILDLSRILAGHGEFQSSWGCDTCILLLEEDIQTTPEMGREHPAFFWFRIILGNFTSYKHVWNSCGFEVWDELQNNLWIHRNSHISPVGWLWSSSAQDLLQQCWWLTWVRRSLRWKHPNQGMTPAVAASDKRFFWMDAFGSAFFLQKSCIPWIYFFNFLELGYSQQDRIWNLTSLPCRGYAPPFLQKGPKEAHEIWVLQDMRFHPKTRIGLIFHDDSLKLSR